MAKALKKKVVEEKKEEEVVVHDAHNPGFDPDIPENRQRWLR